MNRKFVVAMFLAGGLTIAATAAQADGIVSSLNETSAVEMSQDELGEVRGANHVIRLVEFRSGTTLSTAAAADATRDAGSIGGLGQDRPNIIAQLP
jgi:hypothetical protein